MLWLRHPVSLLLIACLALLGVLRSYSPPAPVDAGVPDVEFSAYRAEPILRDLLQDGVPHVAGSAANARVRDRIVKYLRAFGYQPEIQSRFHCNVDYGTCSPIDNIIAVKLGAVGKHAILLTAHYDSGWAGPGAADDGAGVAAILEIARMSADFPAFDNDVIFLFSDSEENGLIGADAFARHHPLFPKVRAVLNLEARGVTGPSAMFETGQGNRGVIRMLSNSVPRPVANSLVYELYQRMPNDTDYSVYRQRGIMGLNFAFAEGVALYHSMLDDPDHLDLGSLQHHGENAWGMLTALGERDLTTINKSEDAGYVDWAGLKLTHYPLSIAGGLALFLGVWVMLAIGLAFRKEFRYRQLRWGLLAVPLLVVAIIGIGYLLSWPLGQVTETHPLEHPYPWLGRLTLFLAIGLVGYVTLKLFSGKVSACAWMIIAWALVFLLALVLASRLPGASYIALIPLAGFALGSAVDLFRKKSPAPLLVASVTGFAAAAYISLYHSFLFELIANFDRSWLRVAPLALAAVVAMPMLLAFAKGRELSWRPARWLLGAIVLASFAHLLMPGFTAERPRDMSLMYREVEGSEQAWLVLESVYRQPDRDYARGHEFELQDIEDERLGHSERPVRAVTPLGLAGVEVVGNSSEATDTGWLRRLEIELPPPGRFLQLTLPAEAGLLHAAVNGEPALDAGSATGKGRKSPTLRVVNPGAGTLVIHLLLSSPDAFEAALVTWHDLPGVLTAPFLGNWPEDARPAMLGPRAEKVQLLHFEAAD